MQQWIVLYRPGYNGSRFASFPLTPENMAEIRKQVYLLHLQTDITGTEHHQVIGIKRQKRSKRNA